MITPDELEAMIINVAEEAIRDKFDAVRASRGLPRMEKTDLQRAIENSLKDSPSKTPAKSFSQVSEAGPSGTEAWSTGSKGRPHCLSPAGHLAKQLPF